MFVLFVSCKDKNTELVSFSYDSEKVPTIVTDTVNMLISDSGITRYRILSDKWLMYERAKEPYWHFPLGVYMEQFDEAFDVEFSVKSDSAWFYKNEGLWKLNGNVRIENSLGERFDSEEFFWNQQQGTVYSNQYIEINRGPMLIKAIGFRSNQEMTEWQILSPYDSEIPYAEQPEYIEPYPSDTLQVLDP